MSMTSPTASPIRSTRSRMKRGATDSTNATSPKTG